ncbi:hypothetical protein Btru_003609 [Bulinus truncatus]|nr:hypothetical protein Btru_003609 [Bulinus truncatus]
MRATRPGPVIAMSALTSDTFPSLDSKSSSLLIGDGEHQYRQRYQNMKLVAKELQEQVALYKNRCAGVDTVALMLKESKMEVLKLTRQCKALETAVANLQNRLSINGLPSSVNIEESERFVPGASKQTLDNLARENSRLRSQLKSGENQSGKKSDEVPASKEFIDNLESENRELKAKLEQISIEKKDLEQKLNNYLQTNIATNADNLSNKKNGIEIGCQTSEIQPNVIEEFRKSLKMFSSQCLKLDSDLEVLQYKNLDKTTNLDNNEKLSRITEESYADLEQKLKQAILMNQRWQAHNDSQEQQVHLLSARIAELEEISQEMERKMEMERIESEATKMENAKLKHDIDNLTRETLQRRQQPPQFDPSIVEILKQQIQVCTEDFNTERKDREQAVNRAKILQDDNNRLNQEIVRLKQNLDLLRSSPKLPPESHLNRTTNPIYQPPVQNFRFRPRGDYIPQKLPQQLFPNFSSTGTSPAPSISPVTSPVPMSLSSSNLSGDRSSYSPSSQESQFKVGPGFSTQRGPMARSEMDYNSLPRSSRSSTPDIQHISNVSQPSDASNVSMPLGRKSSSTKSKGEYLTCPKCNLEFSEDQNKELLCHIDKCNA